MAMRDYGPAPGHAGGKHPVPLDRYAAARQQRQSMRIGDAERESAATELGDHFAAGRLTLDELHERIDLVLAARTRGQLGRVMRDLPSVRREPRPPAAPAPPGRPLPSDSPRPSPSGASYDGRLAAIGLLLLAMLIWLFTVVMFTRHGYYHPPYYPHHHPYSPWGRP